MELSKSDLDKIIGSLTYSKKAIEESTTHPDYESKKKSLNEIDEVLNKVRAMKKDQKS